MFIFHISVTIYRCEVLAKGECGLCHNINHTLPQLQCNWCDKNCKYQADCRSHQPEPCPKPQIQIVSLATKFEYKKCFLMLSLSANHCFFFPSIVFLPSFDDVQYRHPYVSNKIAGSKKTSSNREDPIIRPSVVLVESGLNNEQVSFMRPISIEKYVLVLSQVCLITWVALILSWLYRGILLYLIHKNLLRYILTYIVFTQL